MDTPQVADALCTGSGMLAGTNVWLPDDPTERYLAAPELIACSRLFCSACRSWVRHLDNVRFDEVDPPYKEIERLYVDPDAERYSGFKRGWLGWRVYLCRCTC